MPWLAILVLVLFSVFGLGCLLLVVLGLPGTWVLLALAAGIELLDARYLEPGADVTFGWGVIGVGVALAALGEFVEGMAGVAGAKAGGGTRRGMIGALIGGIGGALFFTPVIPIPILGTLIGAMLGTFGGAFVAEATGESELRMQGSFKAAFAATVGRLFGTLGKTMIAATVWILLVAAAIAQ